MNLQRQNYGKTHPRFSQKRFVTERMVPGATDPTIYSQLLDQEADEQGLDLYSYDLVVCSGGDGTLNIMASFCQERYPDVTIAYVPSGSTNDYAYSIGIPDNMEAALRNTLTGTARRIDIGKFNDKYFLYVAAFGIFTRTSYSTSQKSKNLLGHMAYILEGIKQISEIRSYHMKISAKNIELEGSYMLGLVTNTLSVGGIKNLLPKDDIALDDGEFEVLLIQPPSNLAELHGIVTALLKEKLENAAYITFFKSPTVSIQAEEKIAWTLDGEYGGEEKDVEIVNMEKKLMIICEEGSKFHEDTVAFSVLRCHAPRTQGQHAGSDI